MAEALTKEFTDTPTLVHVARENSGFKTFDGITLGADRLFHELFALLEKLTQDNVKVTKISFVGYSLGGIYARYLIGMLEEVDFFDHVEPVIYTTFATPHVGSEFYAKGATSKFLNFFGSKFLGVTGLDLFHISNIFEDLANPNRVFYKGLQKFKHLYLFANCTFDRTVPFWTSYISEKNPFKKREFLDLRYYDHLKNTKSDYKLSPTGKIPFLVDMDSSKYLSKPRSPYRGPSPVEKRMRVLVIILFPIFFPLYVVVMSVATLIARTKYSLAIEKVGIDHDSLVSHLKDAIRDAKTDTSSKASKVKSLGNAFQDDIADAAGEVMEDMLINSNTGYGNGKISDDRISESPAKPKTDFEGLVNSTPAKVSMDTSAMKIISNLNTLPWNKFAVKLRHMNAHAEIVNRRKRKGQGYELGKFYARLARQLIDRESGSTNEV